MCTFALHPDIDIAALAEAYARDGAVRITPFLRHDVAEGLYEMLRSRTDWMTVLNSGNKPMEFGEATRRAMTDDQRAALDEAVYASARAGFQYRYETLRVPDEDAAREESDDVLAKLAQWMSGDPVRDMLRRITGVPAIDFADMQATAYAPGDFLTGHDDAVAGKRRHAAYILGLTPVWRIEWGGLLLLHDADRPEVRGYAPHFNTITLLRVPQMHSVSEVSRAAAVRRYSVTGWLRSR